MADRYAAEALDRLARQTVYPAPQLEFGELGRPGDFAARLTLFRHGETTANAAGLATGRAEVPLSDIGRRQAEQVASKLERRYDLAVSSSLGRSRETLDIALRAGGIEAGRVIADPRLDERAMGDLELKPQRTIPEIRAGNLDYRPTGGESYGELTLRVLSFLVDLAAVTRAASPRRLDVLVCAHVGPIRIFVGILRGMEDSAEVMTQPFANAELVHLEMRELRWPPFLGAR